jgi:hypothetical protein
VTWHSFCKNTGGARITPHDIFLSRPKEVAALIEKAAKAAN